MKIGFIGLGIMGKPMCRNLLKAGYVVKAYDIVTAAVDYVAEAGAIPCKTASEAAEEVEVVITMLPNSPQVKEVVLGENGIWTAMKAGTVLIDMSSIAPAASKEICGYLADKGIEMLDAPVSGGEPKAIDGTLSIMVGGKRELVERFKYNYISAPCDCGIKYCSRFGSIHAGQNGRCGSGKCLSGN